MTCFNDFSGSAAKTEKLIIPMALVRFRCWDT